MSINDNDKEMMQLIEADNELKWSHIIAAVRIWRRSHNPLTTFFSFRWFKPQGMPTFISDLKKLLDANQPNWEKDEWTDAPLPAHCITTLGVMLDDRARRNSYSTQNSDSNSSIIARALKNAVYKHESRTKPSVNNVVISKEENDYAAVLREILKNRLYYGGDNDSTEDTIQALIYIHANIDKIVNTRLSYGMYSIFANFHAHSIPIHMHEWKVKGGRDFDINPEKAKTGLSQLVAGVVAAYQLAKERNELKTFYRKLYGGDCIESRTDAVLSWLADLKATPFQDIDEALTEWATKAEAYLQAMGKEINSRTVASFIMPRVRNIKFKLPKLEKDASSSAQKFTQKTMQGYQQRFPSGYISSRVGLEDYLVEVLAYETPSINETTVKVNPCSLRS